MHEVLLSKTFANGHWKPEVASGFHYGAGYLMEIDEWQSVACVLNSV